MRPPFLGLKDYDINELFSDKNIATPCYVIDEAALKANGEKLSAIRKATGCKILLAQKAFSNYDLYPALEPYLDGTEASGIFEARLGREEMPSKEVHVFCGAYRDKDFPELFDYADHIVFNSIHQLAKFGPAAKAAGKSIGLRINPQRSTQEGHAIYDPCAPGSRLGTPRSAWDKEMTPELLNLLDGLHSHTLCQQNSDDLATTVEAIEEKFGDILPRLKWLNLGGGHHITRPGYDTDTLIKTINYLQDKYGFTVYLEPGEACAINAGYLVTEVLDVLTESAFTNADETDKPIIPAIVDASAACHMPDVIEMPYRPPLMDAISLEDDIAEGETFDGCDDQSLVNNTAPNFPYRLGGPTCLSGDSIGDYAFAEPLKVGDRLIFGDMAIYSTCKNNTFNGMPLPTIYKLGEDGTITLLKSFGYSDFKIRLGK